MIGGTSGMIGRFAEKLRRGESVSRELLAAILTVGLVLMIGGPVLFFVWGSVWSTAPGLPGGSFTLDGYRNLVSSDVIESFVVTLQIAVLGTIIAIGFSIAATMLATKYDFPGRGAIPLVLIVQYLLPGFTVAIAWELMISSINRLLMGLPFVGSEPFNINSVVGISVVAGLHYVGLVYLLTNGSIQSVPASLEEAAKVNGASNWTTLRRITLRLSLPAFLVSAVLVFTRLMQSFGIPLILGLPERIFVLATHMFVAIQTYPPAFAQAAAIGMVILAVSLLGLYFQGQISGPRERYETIGGREASLGTARYSLGRYRYPIAALMLGALLVFYVFPFLIVFISSFQQAFLGLDFTYVIWTLGNYESLFVGSHQADFARAVANTLIISAVGAFLGMILSSLASYIIVKSESPLGEFLNFLTLSPAALPGIVVATAFLWLFLTYNFLGLYGTIWLIMLALTARFIVYGTRATNSAFRSISDEMEEMAELSGAGLFSIFRNIFVPLIRPGFVSGYLLLFVDYMKVLTIPLLLSSANSDVVAVMIWRVYSIGQATLAAAIVTLMALTITVLYAGAYFFADVDITRI